jgi:phosphatidate cytidylyltransferase
VIEVVGAAWIGWGVIFVPWGLHAAAARERSRRARRLARVPVWIAVALIETAVCLTGWPAAWGLLLLAAGAACALELARSLAWTPLPWVCAIVVLGLASAFLSPPGLGALIATAAAVLLALPYGGGALGVARVAGLVYFGAAPLVGFAAVGDRWDLAFAFATATTTHVADIAAGFAGKLGGWRPLPRLSPGKTLAGFAGAGLGGGAIGALIYAYGLGVPVGRAVVLGVIVAAAGAVGDLAASKIKRVATVKDFGRLLGPHGGMGDRLDSVVAAMALLPVLSGWAPRG